MNHTTKKHYIDTELMDLAEANLYSNILQCVSASVMQGDNGWVVAYNGNVHLLETGQDAFDYLQGLRKHPATPVEHRPYLKNLARRLYAAISLDRELAALTREVQA
ncbi:MAG: hypothetical protein ACTHJ9_00610 [Rhodanobacter sp.]